MKSVLLLHEIIIQILNDAGKGLTIAELAREIESNKLWNKPSDGKMPTNSQISARISSKKDLFYKDKNGLIYHKEVADENRLFRLTWNTEKWVKPIQHQWKPSNQGNSNIAHENQYGYGHEEWLFNDLFFHDGYQYGVIRGASNIRNQFKVIKEAFLFTINQETSERFVVGSIKNLELIADYSQLNSIAKELLKNAQPQMRLDLIRCKADANNLKNQFEPCIRFKLEDARIYRNMQPSEELNSIKYRRFMPYIIEGALEDWLLRIAPVDDEVFHFSEGKAKNTLSYEKNIRAGKKKITRQHSAITDALEVWLNADHSLYHGKLSIESCKFGVNIADIVIQHPDNTYTIMEVKTSYNVRRNIREALGQLLDYASWYSDLNIKNIIIVSPCALEFKDLTFLRRIKKMIKMNLQYWQYLPKSTSNKFIITSE
jgi:hypothetical protein